MRARNHAIGLFAFLWMSAGTAAVAKDITFYKIEGAPGLLAGILLKGGELHAVFNWATADSTETNTFNKLLRLKPGQQVCTNMRSVDLGLVEDSTPCMRLNKVSGESYVVDVDVKYKFPNQEKNLPLYMSVLKGGDYVRERRFTMAFDLEAASCSAMIVKRSYLAIDGNVFVPSKTGKLKCLVK